MRFCYADIHIPWNCVAMEAPTHVQGALKRWSCRGFVYAAVTRQPQWICTHCKGTTLP